MKVSTHVFETFPKFSRLTMDDKEKYEALVAAYPSYAEFSFPYLMTWWSGFSNCSVAQLNGNLVISYWFPGYEDYSGLSVVGTHDVDETIAFVMDYLKQRGEFARLVHVPEFVVSSMRYPELYSFKDERSYDECILSVEDLRDLGSMIRHKRWRVRRFMAEVDQSRVDIKQLDLSRSDNRQLLLAAATEWETRGG